MITFVVLNTASFQLIPTTIALLRMKNGAEAPFDILPAVWISSAVSVVVAILFAKRWHLFLEEFLMAAAMIPLVIAAIVGYGLVKGAPVFDLFLEGAKEGLATSARILPALIGLVVAVGMFRVIRRP
jgi:hypothetical protein